MKLLKDNNVLTMFSVMYLTLSFSYIQQKALEGH